MYLCIQVLKLIGLVIPYSICIDQSHFDVFAPAGGVPCRKQYAVLYMTAERMTDSFHPPPTGYNDDILQVGNNYAATCMNETIRDSHTEPTVLARFDHLVSKFQETYGNKKKPDLYLYTRLSPCTDCSSKIAEFGQTNMRGIANNRLQLSWSKTFIGRPPPTPHQQYLISLQTLLATERVKLNLTPDLTLMQGNMCQCLQNRDDISDFFRRDYELNIANIVNRLAFQCANKDKSNEIRNWECSTGSLKDSLGQNCKRLEHYLEDCLSRSWELGPPLSPRRPMQVSSNLRDVTGYYFPPPAQFIFSRCAL
ncbi:uncharacterized protein LOC130636310 [Hydractinia symbiolongicarpus]|uniref:uncharacterized protein LOC130636310 n=1 Tax=Hydractinia symbiolongicarpus TaxID=13093 RepID=UPI00254C7BD8|nr:uncharacterized protein LOC130636310 [Hydractinia symbiolongicarpus]